MLHTSFSPVLYTDISTDMDLPEKSPLAPLSRLASRLLSTVMSLLSLRRFGTYSRSYLPVWITTVAIYIASWYMEVTAQPFKRLFQLTDPRIQYPFSHKEQFSSFQLWLWAVVFPFAVMLACIGVRFLLEGKERRAKYFHLLHVTTLSFLLALAVNGFVTEFLKLRIGRFRPDFLDRCGPTLNPENEPLNQVYNDTICSKPLGNALFNDGYKSCPSGHASFAWCGFTFINLWISGQFRLHAPIDPDNKSIETSGNSRYHRFHLVQLVNLVPFGLCIHIALSRSQDYRHDFFDISLGSLVGFATAVFVYSQFFRSIFGYYSAETKFSDYKLLEEYETLPM